MNEIIQHIQLPPEGEYGQTPLPVTHTKDQMSFEHIILPAECFPPGARLDWFNDHAQILVDEQGQEEPAVCVRYWPDGSVAEIRIRRDLMSKGIVCAEDTMKLSHWQNTRDRICP